VSWFEGNDRFEIEELQSLRKSASIFNLKILSPPKSIQNDSGACAKVGAGLKR
jgi:hypothetical protein